MNDYCFCESVKFTSPDTKTIAVCHCGFCRRWSGGPMFAVHCGTHLYYKLLATGEYFVSAGAVEPNEFELASQIYIDKKPNYYSFSNQTPMLTEQQVIEQFTSSGGGSAV